MACSISRMQFLRGDFTGRSTPIRPPWALAEMKFVDTCTACGECICVCPTKILKAGRGRFPQIDFSRGGCTLCGDCVRACEPRALSHSVKEGFPWHLKAHFEERCLSMKGMACYTCQEVCDQSAIQFRPALGGRARPEVDFSACNGCGACYAPCPVNAVSMRSVAV